MRFEDFRKFTAMTSFSESREVPSIQGEEPAAFFEWGAASEFDIGFRTLARNLRFVSAGLDPNSFVFDEIERVEEVFPITAVNMPEFSVNARRATSITFTKRGDRKVIKSYSEFDVPHYEKPHYIWTFQNDGPFAMDIFRRIRAIGFPKTRFVLVSLVSKNTALNPSMALVNPPNVNVDTAFGTGGEMLKWIGQGTYTVEGGGEPIPATPYPFSGGPYTITGYGTRPAVFSAAGGTVFNLRPGMPTDFVAAAIFAAGNLGIPTLGADGNVMTDAEGNESQWRVQAGPVVSIFHYHGVDGGSETLVQSSGVFSMRRHDGGGFFPLYIYRLWQGEQEVDSSGAWALGYIGLSEIFKTFGAFYAATGNADVLIEPGGSNELDGATVDGRWVLHLGDIAKDALDNHPDPEPEEDDTKTVIMGKLYLAEGAVKQANFSVNPQGSTVLRTPASTLVPIIHHGN